MKRLIVIIVIAVVVAALAAILWLKGMFSYV